MNESKKYKCKKCGRELPVEMIATHGKKKDGSTKIMSICKECSNLQNRNWRKEKNIKRFLADETLKIGRKYKNVRQERVLPIEDTEIVPVNDDEIFVRLLDYRNVWISNYGRAVAQYGSRYAVMHKKTTLDGETAYMLYKNVYNGEKWVYEKRLVEAWKLVVQEFIINYDIANNSICWHKGNNKEDNYYKNLYPLNEKQYAAVQKNFLNVGDDSEESVLAVINDVAYKADNWNPIFMRKTSVGVGYLGRDGAVYNNPAYKKWINMMQRCYCDKVHEYKPYYKKCTVCEEWWNFSNFEVWYHENNIDGKKLDLDKDILLQGNTEYAPDTCALVSHYANTIFERNRGIATSIVKNSQTGMFDASMSLLGKKIEIGSFETMEIAQSELFEYRKNYIVKYAVANKNKVPDKVYYAMKNWKTEPVD